MSSIRLFEPTFGREEETAVLEVLRSGRWADGSGYGKVFDFELALQQYVGNYVIAVNSGTAALHLALSLLDIKGKEVILPALSFVSTANAILYNGGIPIFADVDRETLCLNPDTAHITDKTACIIPVHFGGMKAYTNYGTLPVVEDSAHRIERNSVNNITCYSFHPVKNLAMPCGGAIALSTPRYNKILEARRWCGITDRDEDGYDVKELGWNYYMNEISAAIGIEQLKKLDDMNDRRRTIASYYKTQLNNDCMPYESDCSYHLFWLLVDDRVKFRKKMADAGIETGIHYRPIDQMSLYYKYPQAKLEVTAEVGNKIVSIPIHASLTDQDVDKVIRVANS